MFAIEAKLGIFGKPAIIGIVVGEFLSLLTGQDIDTLLKIAMSVAAAMVLIPRMVGEDSEVYIGRDIALGLGDPACITTTEIMIPVTIFPARNFG